MPTGHLTTYYEC